MKHEIEKLARAIEKGLRTQEQFKRAYKECKSYGDWDKLFENTPPSMLKKIRDAHQIVTDTTGLTMREEAFLSSLKGYIKYTIEGN
jgi:hypothetical protein